MRCSHLWLNRSFWSLYRPAIRKIFCHRFTRFMVYKTEGLDLLTQPYLEKPGFIICFTAKRFASTSSPSVVCWSTLSRMSFGLCPKLCPTGCGNVNDLLTKLRKSCPTTACSMNPILRKNTHGLSVHVQLVIIHLLSYVLRGIVPNYWQRHALPIPCWQSWKDKVCMFVNVNFILVR